MVDSTDDLNLDVDGKAKGGKLKLIVLIAAVLLLLVGAVVATLFFTGFFEGGESAESEEPATSERVDNREPIYHPINNQFTVNLSEGEFLQYLQTQITVMAYEAEAIEALEQHMPRIQNNLIQLLSAQNPDELVTVEGRTALHDEILASINEVLEQQGSEALVQDIYFTKFIMQ